ncbi:CBN-SPP-20 protein [Caenorhabditis brenneri]|uniref:CBN-SPP-20 protein n=1 Tax=Caenorhabditis brenneri TaxID=135651 RepID=G0MXW8_CAEBE|nr:CBN-SPP-20 protein [Caenorhabditis brenneri]
MLRTLFILVAVISFSHGLSIFNTDPISILICNGCQMVVTFVTPILKQVETITRTDISTLADKLCARVPDLEIFHTLCTTVKNDIIDIAVQLIEAVERQVNGNVTCKALRLCPDQAFVSQSAHFVRNDLYDLH